MDFSLFLSIPFSNRFSPLTICISHHPHYLLCHTAEKRVAIAPGTAFDTSYEAMTCFHDNNNAIEEEDNKGKIKNYDPKLKARQQQRLMNRDHEKVLNCFCRLSLANSMENLLEGIHRICDFMDERTCK